MGLLIREAWFETNRLEAVVDFYAVAMKLSIESRSGSHVCFRAGDSLLGFRRSKRRSIYHFAFNVSPDRLEEAVKLLRVWVDPIFSQATERIRFENWRADSYYFFDPVGNVIELIAREQLPPGSDGESIFVNVGEVGLALRPFVEERDQIAAATGLQVFRGSVSDDFTALGEEQGLLILAKEDRVWYPTDNVRASRRPCEIRMSGIAESWQSADGLLKIVSV